MYLIFVESILVSPDSEGFFIKLSSIECVPISLKFREFFVKLIFTKFCYFVKVQGDFIKVWGFFFAKLT